jgi:hypothetical protein
VNRFVIEELYHRVLPTLLPTEDGILMHDNEHTAYVVRDALDEMQIEVMIWPPQSPGINPIEKQR